MHAQIILNIAMYGLATAVKATGLQVNTIEVIESVGAIPFDIEDLV